MEEKSEWAGSSGMDGHMAPHNSTQAAVAEIWADLLQVQRVDANDNFLSLGGESLLAAQAASRIRARFGCDVTIRLVLLGTVAEIAAEISMLLDTR